VPEQQKLVVEILRCLGNAGILSEVLLIGSWCAAFYKDYFKGVEYYPRIKTRDIDFLVKNRPRFPKEIDIEDLLKPLGFDIEFFGKGYMKLESDELLLEFIVHEAGRPTDKPFPLRQLKFNAQPLRHMAILWRNPISVNIKGAACHLPHPADYAMQKLITAATRKKKDKVEKDRQSALLIIDALIARGELAELKIAHQNLSKKEQKYVRGQLEILQRLDIF